MKKHLVKIISVALIVSSSIGLFGCKSSTGNKVDEIKKAGVILVGTSGDYPPYEFHGDVNGKDEIVGFDIEIAKQIAKDLGVKLVIKDMKFDALLASLNTNKVDFVMAGMTPTPERATSVDFSKIYYTAVQTIVIRAKDKDLIKNLADLKDKVIAVQKGSIQEGIAKEQLPNSKVIALPKISDEILELKNNKVDALIVEAPVAAAYISNNKDLIIAEVKLQGDDSGSAVGIKKGNTALVDAVNKTLDKLITEKQIDKLVTDATDKVIAK
ncbi:MAG: transporter substrate-binding domain-containing protein [Clostridiaceae bacterium]|nr:transporter substrate-binding domain-containing protein [Clostridiaceae bacterium]